MNRRLRPFVPFLILMTAILLGLALCRDADAASLKPNVTVNGVPGTNIPAGGTLLLPTAATDGSIILTPGSDPGSTPTNGACWIHTTAGFKCRVNGSTVTYGSSGVVTFNGRSGTVVLLNTDVSGVGGLLSSDIGSTVQAHDADLDALAALTGTNNFYYRSASNTWTAVTIGANCSFTSGTLNCTGSGLGTGLTSAHIFVGNGSNVAADVAASGDLTLTNAGVFTLNTVTVAKGGTGQVTLGNHCVLIGAGTGGLNTACPNSAGKLLRDNGPSADPTFETFTSSNCANPCTIGAAGIQQITGSPSSSLAPGYISERSDGPPYAYLARITATAIPARIQEAVITTSYTVTLGTAPTVGNVEWAFCFKQTSLPTAASGWTNISTHNASANDPYARLLYHRIVIGDTTSVTPCTGSDTAYGASVIETSGIDPDPSLSIQASAFASASGTGSLVTTINATTSSTDTLAVAFGGFETVTTSSQGTPVLSGSSWTHTAGTNNGFATNNAGIVIGSVAFPSTSSSVVATVTNGASTFTGEGLTGALLLLQPPTASHTGSVPFVVETSTPPTAGQIAVFDADTSAVGGKTVSGDCTATAALLWTCPTLNGVSPGTLFNQNYATPPAWGGTTPAAIDGTTITAHTHFVDQSMAGSGDRCVHAKPTGQLEVVTADCATTGGGGTVTNIATSGGVCGGPITSTGTISLCVVITPQGRLSLVSATPVQTSDQTAKTTLYYVETAGNLLPVYDGTNMVPLTFSNLSAILDTTNHKADQVFDFFGYDSGGGTAALGIGPAWTTSATITVTIATPAVVSWTGHGLAEGAPVVFTTTGALPTGITAGTVYYVSQTGLGANAFDISTTRANATAGTNVATSGSQSGTHTGTNHTTARGTGAGTSELELKNGLPVNKNTVTLFNNSSSASVTADKATYLGSCFTTADGQTGVAMKPAAASLGNAPTIACWNAYNRAPAFGLLRDSQSHTYTGGAWRALAASATDRVYVLQGLARDNVTGVFMDGGQENGCPGGPMIGIDFDTSTAAPDSRGATNSCGNGVWSLSTDGAWYPTLGYHYYQAVEFGGSASSTINNCGGVSCMGMTINTMYCIPIWRAAPWAYDLAFDLWAWLSRVANDNGIALPLAA